MKSDQAAKRVTVLVGESDRFEGRALYEAVVSMLHAEGVAGATATRAILGFGSTGRTHAAHLLDLSEDLPVTIMFVDTAETVERVLPKLEAMMTSGLVAIDDVRAITFSA